MKYRLQDLIDIDHFQNLQDRLNKIYSFPSSIIDNDGNILTATAWQEICTNFHRKNREAERICIESDQYIVSHIHEANPAVSYRCPHGLVDNATPIIIDGIHYGSFFTGQFFMEEPDLVFFRTQARKYGFDEESYIRAVKKAPIWTKEQLANYLFFIKGLIAVISESGMKKLKEIENRKIIEKSEKRYRSILKAAIDGYWLADKNGRLLEVNDAYCRMSGYTEQELLGMNVSDLLAVETLMHLTVPPKKLMEKGQDPFETKHRRKDGRRFDVEVSVQYLLDEGGKLVAFLRDVTESKHAKDVLEQALHARERQTKELQLLLDGAKVVLEGRDFPSTARRIFDSACEMTGAVSGYVALLSDDGEENEVLFLESGGLPCSVDESLPMPIRGLRGEAYKAGKAVYDNNFMNSPWVEFLPHGHVELRNVMFAPLNIEGRTNGIMGLANKSEDFNEDDLRVASAFGQLAAIALKNSRTMEALKESEEKLHTIVEYSPVGMFLDDKQGHAIYINSRCAEIIGVPANQALSLNWVQYLHPDDRERVTSAWAKAVKHGEPFNQDYRYIHPDGQVFWTRGEVSPVRNSQGQLTFFIGTMIDITQQKQGEAVKENLESQLVQAHKMEAIGTLIGGVAHDFNNLLQAINGHTELLLMDKGEKDPEYGSLEAIKDSGNRAVELVRNLLLFSRKAEIERAPIELNIEIEHARRILERTIPKMVEIDVFPGRCLWTIMADPVQIEQILLNLGSNAADAMPDGGKLVIETDNITLGEDYALLHAGAQPGRYVLLTISDNGHGMDHETRNKIFEPFFTTKEIGQGTGLGLASVYGIVKKHGGYIACYSEVGQGTTFKIYLPAMEQQAEEDEKERNEEHSKGGDETILLVDDEEAVRGFVEQALMKLGYRVYTASTGEEALEFYPNRTEEIDLVITDIGMPGMGGRKFLQELLQINPAARVIIASGYPMQGKVKKTMKTGAKGYVGKPYQLTDLLNKVRGVLDGKS